MRQYKNPKALVERLAGIHTERRALQEQADALHVEERELLGQALVLLPAHDLSHLSLPIGSLRIGTQPIATIQDWPTLVQTVASHAEDGNDPDRFLSVIHKRVSATALEKLSFDRIFLSGVLLEHKKVATFTAPREKK